LMSRERQFTPTDQSQINQCKRGLISGRSRTNFVGLVQHEATNNNKLKSANGFAIISLLNIII